MTLQSVINAIQDVCLTVSGIKGAPDYAPEQINVYPFVVTYPGEGSIQFGTTDEMKALHDVIVEVHVARKDLPMDMRAVAGFVDSIPAVLLADPTLAGTCSTFQSIRYRFGALGWGGQDTLGYRFTVVGVKVRTAL